MQHQGRLKFLPFANRTTPRHSPQSSLTIALSRVMAAVAGEVCVLMIPSISYSNIAAELLQALAFGYFETLIRLGDISKIRAEIERLKGCNRMLDVVGYSEDTYKDFTDETFELFEQLAANLPSNNSTALLLNTFNDEGLSAAITYHFRV